MTMPSFSIWLAEQTKNRPIPRWALNPAAARAVYDSLIPSQKSMATAQVAGVPMMSRREMDAYVERRMVQRYSLELGLYPAPRRRR